jgi:U3 small nucleolar RNA-associated protein 13
MPGKLTATGKAAKAAPVYFATGGQKGLVKLWRSDTGKCFYEQPAVAAQASGAAGGVEDMVLLPGAAGLLTATQDCRLLFHHLEGDTLAVSRQLIGNNDEITDMRFISLSAASSSAEQTLAGPAQPTHLAVASNSDQIRVFDAATTNCTATLCGHSEAVLALDVLQLPHGVALLASAGKDAAVRLWSLPAARCIGERCGGL